MKLWTAAFLLLVSLLLPCGRVEATQCDCKPEFEVASEAEGTCEVTRDDKKWCRIKFNTGSTASGPRQQEFVEAVKKLTGLTFDHTLEASRIVNMTEPEKWDEAFVREHLAALFAIAVWDSAPERLKTVVSLVRDRAREFVGPLQKREQQTRLELGGYRAVVSYGCVDLSERDFSVMVKTRFSTTPRRCGER